MRRTASATTLSHAAPLSAPSVKWIDSGARAALAGRTAPDVPIADGPT